MTANIDSIHFNISNTHLSKNFVFSWIIRPLVEDYTLIKSRIDVFCGPFCAHGKLNWPSDLQTNEAKSNMKHPSDMPRWEIRKQVVVIFGPMRYQLDHGGAPAMKRSWSLKTSWFPLEK